MNTKETKMKSYNTLPNPLADFLSCLLACGIAGTVLMILGYPLAEDAISEALAYVSAALGTDPPAARAFAIASLALASLAISAYSSWYSYHSFHNGVWAGEKPSPSRAYGSARINSTPSSLRSRFAVWRKGSCPEPGLVMGGIGSSRNRLLVAPVQNALVVGGTGSGKTTSCLAPTQIGLIDAGCSTLTLDPKGEIYSLTSRRALERGAKVICIDFSDASSSDAWQPLQPAIECAKGIGGRSPSEMAAEVRILASTLIPHRRESSPIWTNAARILFSGLCSFVAASPRVPEECRNLPTVASLAAMPQETMQAIVEELPPGSSARQQLSSVAYAPAETFGGFATNLNTLLDPFADPSISPMLSRPGFTPRDFVDGQCCLYVRFNSGSTAYDALVSAFIAQTLDSLRRIAEREIGGPLTPNVWCLFEEFPQLPKIDGMQKCVSIVRSAGIKMIFVAQDRSQIEAVYREDAPAIFNNLDTTLFLASNDLRTCRHYSDALGSYTVETEQRSQTKGGAGSSTKSIGLHESKLFRPEDLTRWDWRTGHLVIDRGDVFACSSLPISKTFVGDEIGLGGREPDASRLAILRPDRPARAAGPAPVWSWSAPDAGGAVADIASAIADVGDPRYL